MKLVRDIINTRELSLDYFKWIVKKAQIFYNARLSGDERLYKNLLNGWNVLPLFTQKSTRTHDSFLEALNLMGARHNIGISDPTSSSLGKGETLADTIDTYIGYGAQFIVLRDSREGSAKWAKICALRSFSRRVIDYIKRNRRYPKNILLPLIFNGGDGSHNHPSQHLLDCAAINYHFKKFTNLNIGIINDLKASRVFASQVDAAAMLKWNLHLFALPGAEIKQREKLRLKNTKTNFKIYSKFNNFEKNLSKLDVLYVHRFQKNLREGNKFDVECNPITREMLKKNKFKKNSIVMHARPIDKEVKEINDTLRYHSWNFSDIQSDFGLATRMAMAYYAIENDLFSLINIIKSLNTSDFGFVKKDLSNIKPKKTMEKFTTAYVQEGYVIDHIPFGCGISMQGIINQLIPHSTTILASNVKGKHEHSIKKDVIKMHGKFEWTKELDNLIAIFRDISKDKSCVVSKFENGKRVKKWAFKTYHGKSDCCINPKCITREEFHEGIIFKMNKKAKKYECPFCHTLQ